MEELFEVVDKSGKALSLEKRSIVHSKGLLHKGVYLLLFDEKGRLFVQQRAQGKDLMPLRWDLSVAEHLLPKETYENASLRGAKEELNAKVRNLKFLAEKHLRFELKSGKIDNELNQLFVGETQGKIKFQDGEVKQGKFISLKELLLEMQQNPEKFTPWFLQWKKEIKKLAKESALP